MKTPYFFDKIETIKVYDPLAEVLGAFSDGSYEFSYEDIVKSAGHSCPTVAGAYICTQVALKTLYPEQSAVRGKIEVSFNAPLEEGVTGVISNVITQITGATDKSGFKGLNGKFARHSLMHFANVNSKEILSITFTRMDNEKSVKVVYDPSSVKPDPNMMDLMPKMLQGQATVEELSEFASLWQDRVKRIFDNVGSVVKVTRLES
jgi:hypothetical protein